MTLENWIRILKSGPKFYRLADFIKLSGLSYHCCRVNIARLVQKGLLIKLGKEFFGSTLVSFSAEEAICQSYLPSYLSYEYALSRHGVLDQMPYAYTAATTRRSKKTKMGNMEVIYRHQRKNLFWGYVSEGEAFIAEPEKALLDWLYLRRREEGGSHLDEIHWEEMDIPKLKSYSKRFPKEVQKKIEPFLSGVCES